MQGRFEGKSYVTPQMLAGCKNPSFAIHRAGPTINHFTHGKEKSPSSVAEGKL